MSHFSSNFLSFLCFFSLFIIYFPLDSDSKSYLPDYSTCIRSYDAGQQLNSQQSIRFFNGCGEDLYINVCILDESGETKLYSSGRTVPSYGNYTISTFPFSSPKKVVLSAAPFSPAVPSLCQPKAT
ncbi:MULTISPECIES: hypothetical protein [Parachlamydia]|jgi:hypothetical protein|uniref:Uncharacterized protein n=2 Tax=Parachlamydia acanthamoebae TaxID=83552 RepID=F8KXG0_PARAV|nr:hypothetical protein [Parachlamydia acanthamoebae]EFB42538.1 hypothetical protein pah_c004o025 [Parachlamydia acanthamoebae str. Hall's coccus]KIA77297.1 hypothetical protein DB43_GN00050 [Parachlamydia acanthamoebae]CCB86989.1 putative uncharacterized protein [Parachlamydia acanthamoebae UV-7]